MLREICHQIDLRRRRIAGNAAAWFQADRRDRIAGLLVCGDILIDPERKVRIRQVQFVAGLLVERRVGEKFGDPRQLGNRRVEVQLLYMDKFFLDLAGIFFLAEFVDEDLDPSLVLVVAPAVAVVDAQAGLGIADQVLSRDEVADFRSDHRGAAHAAADEEFRAQFARVIVDQLDTDIVQAHGCPVGVAGDHSEFEFPGEIGKFRVKAGPLPQQFCPRTRIGDFVGGSAGELVGGNVADAIAAGLDRVHLDRGQVGENIGGIGQLDPVILNILAGGEMTIVTIIFARDMGEHVHLLAAQRAIGNGNPQHIGVELQIEAVHQSQRLELVLGQLAGDAPFHLVAEFLDSRVDHLLVILVILIHVRSPIRRHRDRPVSMSGRDGRWVRARAPGP